MTLSITYDHQLRYKVLFLTAINRHGTKQILNQLSSPFKGPSICGSGEALLYLERLKW